MISKKFFFVGFLMMGLIVSVMSMENNTSNSLLSLDQWTYIQVDAERGKWGDFDKPDWLKYFGLAAADLTADGQKDILSGRYFYRNPGIDMTGRWERIDLGKNVDAILTVDVDNDEKGDGIAQALPDVFWLEMLDPRGETWKLIKIGSIPATDHVNGQGFVTAEITAGGKPEILIASGDGIHCLTIPDNPKAGNWPKVRIAAGTCSEGIGVGDIDRDGLLDIAAASEKQDFFAWWKNPGDGSGEWTVHKIGKTAHDGDRFEIIDINGDNRADVVISEERYPGPDPDAHLYWFEQPEDPMGEWKEHIIVTEYSVNNLDAADMDGDRDIDVITCEHKGPKGTQKLQIWENDGKGNFTEHRLDTGKESHLGTQVFDMDGDGDLDIVSIAWDESHYLHLWRNDAIVKKK